MRTNRLIVFKLNPSTSQGNANKTTMRISLQLLGCMLPRRQMAVLASMGQKEPCALLVRCEQMRNHCGEQHGGSLQKQTYAHFQENR